MPAVYKFAKGAAGDPKAAVTQMLQARANQTQNINAVFISTNNLDFAAGERSVAITCVVCRRQI